LSAKSKNDIFSDSIIKEDSNEEEKNIGVLSETFSHVKKVVQIKEDAPHDHSSP
jgi:hypothetical protein